MHVVLRDKNVVLPRLDVRSSQFPRIACHSLVHAGIPQQLTQSTDYPTHSGICPRFFPLETCVEYYHSCGSHDSKCTLNMAMSSIHFGHMASQRVGHVMKLQFAKIPYSMPSDHPLLTYTLPRHQYTFKTLSGNVCESSKPTSVGLLHIQTASTDCS